MKDCSQWLLWQRTHHLVLVFAVLSNPPCSPLGIPSICRSDRVMNMPQVRSSRPDMKVTDVPDATVNLSLPGQQPHPGILATAGLLEVSLASVRGAIHGHHALFRGRRRPHLQARGNLVDFRPASRAPDDHPNRRTPTTASLARPKVPSRTESLAV